MSIPDFCKVTVPFYFCISVEWALLRSTSLLMFYAFSLRDFSHSPSSESSFANIFSWCVTFLLILMTLSFSGKKLLISEILADSFFIVGTCKSNWVLYSNFVLLSYHNCLLAQELIYSFRFSTFLVILFFKKTDFFHE